MNSDDHASEGAEVVANRPDCCPEGAIESGLSPIRLSASAPPMANAAATETNVW
jgi:hypothetical protein